MQIKSKRKLFVTLAVVLALLLIGLIIFFIATADSNKPDSSLEGGNSQVDKPNNNESQDSNPEEPTDSTPDDSSVPEEPDKDSENSQNDSNNPNLDPSTVGVIDITPMDLAVSYIKGVGGFEFEVFRTPSGTQYVEFKNTSLVGTKCTNDTGAFATIIENPEAGDSATVDNTVSVEGSSYGLSLVEANCTSDVELLEKYQKSFSDAFHLLKKLD